MEIFDNDVDFSSLTTLSTLMFFKDAFLCCSYSNTVRNFHSSLAVCLYFRELVARVINEDDRRQDMTQADMPNGLTISSQTHPYYCNLNYQFFTDVGTICVPRCCRAHASLPPNACLQRHRLSYDNSPEDYKHGRMSLIQHTNNILWSRHQ